MTTKSKAMNAHAIGVGFTRIFGCQVVEDLKNEMSGSAYAFFVQFHEQAARWCIRLRVLSQCPMRMKPNATMKTIDYITKRNS